MKIAPKLLSGEPRERMWNRLPGPIKYGIRQIAKQEKQSVSWVCEQIIVDWVCSKSHTARPKYRAPKPQIRLVKGRRRAS